MLGAIHTSLGVLPKRPLVQRHDSLLVQGGVQLGALLWDLVLVVLIGHPCRHLGDRVLLGEVVNQLQVATQNQLSVADHR